MKMKSLFINNRHIIFTEDEYGKDKNRLKGVYLCIRNRKEYEGEEFDDLIKSLQVLKKWTMKHDVKVWSEIELNSDDDIIRTDIYFMVSITNEYYNVLKSKEKHE